MVDDNGNQLPPPGVGPTNPNEVWVYFDSQFRGRQGSLSQDVPNLKNISWDDCISSIRVSPGTVAEFYEHPNFGGRSFRAQGDVLSVPSEFNDKFSSVRIYRA